jgi:hypothetical protein
MFGGPSLVLSIRAVTITNGVRMKWFVNGQEGMSLGIKEWELAIKDVENLENMSKLGRKVYGMCLRSAGASADKQMDGAIMAFSHVLHHMLDEMDNDMWADLRWSVQEEWRFTEKTLWESPDALMRSHKLLQSAEPAPPLLMLEQIGHDLLMVVRPNMYRLIWAMLVSDGRKVDLHGLEEADETGSSLLAPMAMLDRLMANGVPEFLDEEEAAGLWHLVLLLNIAGKDGVDDDELLRAIQERKFYVEGKSFLIELYMHSRTGVEFTAEDLEAWRKNLVQSLSALFAFKVMFMASMIGEKGPIHMDGMLEEEAD